MGRRHFARLGWWWCVVVGGRTELMAGGFGKKVATFIILPFPFSFSGFRFSRGLFLFSFRGGRLFPFSLLFFCFRWNSDIRAGLASP